MSPSRLVVVGVVSEVAEELVDIEDQLAILKATLDERTGEGQELRDYYQRYPHMWVDQVLRESIWSKQRHIMFSVRDNKRTAVKAGHGVGKTFIAARIVGWFLSVYPHNSLVITSAPTFHQVRDLLWQELQVVHVHGKLAGRLNLTEWFVGQRLIALGRKGADYNPHTFQGYHEEHILIVLDEACGIPKSLFDAAESLATSAGARILAMSNPDDPQSEFAKACESSQWNVHTISVYSSPAFTGEKVPDVVLSKLVTREWAKESIDRWGEGSPLVISKVYGEFPETTFDGVLKKQWLTRAKDRQAVDGMHILGMDVAGTGKDRTVIRERNGNAALREWVIVSDDPATIINETVDIINESKAEHIVIDTIGVGYGIAGGIDLAKRADKCDVKVHRFVASEAADDSERFANRRAEMWWRFRERCQEARFKCGTLDDELLEELTFPEYWEDSRGRIQIMPTDVIRGKIGRSPDRAVALLQAFYVDKPATVRSFGGTYRATVLPGRTGR